MESISRISSLLETARDLTLDAARDASSARRSMPRELPSGQLKKLLDSRAERDVLEGLRRVVTMSYRQPPSQTLPFFSHVIKNVASPSLQVKKLVYTYLLQHAEHEPDTALLSINTIQKSLTDSNPQLRALALRVMSSIRVPVISQIVSLGIKRGAGDMSPYVRRAAALAIPKCYRLDPNTEPQLIEHLSALLGDQQYFVAGAAVASFWELCPDRLDLIHPHYRSLVRKLVDMDEWGQLATLRLMMVYARKCFPRRTRKVKKAASAPNSKPVKTTRGFYDSESDEEEEEKVDMEEVVLLDPDLELLLKGCQSLLQSRNSAVVIAVARTYLYLGTPEYLVQAIGPLVSLLRSAGDVQHVALYNIVQVCLAHPKPFVSYYTHFLVRSTDAPHIWRLKLELLTLIFPHAQPRLQSLILAELSHFSHSGSLDPALVKESVRAIGRCSQSPATTPHTSSRCLKLLLQHIGSADALLVAESLEVIRHLIQRDPNAHRTTVVRLAKHLDAATSAQARASIIWLVGEFSGIDPENNIAADVLRILVKGFADEAEPAKLQIVLLAAKVYVHHLSTNPPPTPPKPLHSVDETQTSSLLDGFQEEAGFGDQHLDQSTAPIQSLGGQQQPHITEALYSYVLLLVRYDTSFDLRDRARVYKALLSTPTSTQLASLLLLAPKPIPHIPSPSETRKNYLLGSASLVIGDEGGVSGLRGYEDLPKWVKEGKEPDPALRDETTSATTSTYEVSRNMSAADRLDAAVGTGSRATPDSMLSPRSLNGVGGDVMMGGSGSKEKPKEKTLDDWLAEESSSEEETDDDEDEEDDDEEEEEETEEESEYETDSESGEENDPLVKHT